MKYLHQLTTVMGNFMGRVAQSVLRLITAWTFRGSNPGWCEIFHTRPERPWGPPSLLYNGYLVFTGVKSGRRVALTPNNFQVPWSRKSRATPLLPLLAVRPVQSLSACTRVHLTFTFTFWLVILIHQTPFFNLVCLPVLIFYINPYPANVENMVSS